MRVGGGGEYVVEVLEGLHHSALQLGAGGLPVVVVVLRGGGGTDSMTMFW